MKQAWLLLLLWLFTSDMSGGYLKARHKSKVNTRDGAVMIWMEQGRFPVGDADIPDNPRQTVELSGFWVYRDLVTVRMYKRFVMDTGKKLPNEPSWGWNDNHPMVNVSWNDAMAYCKWAGTTLPTEAQWERVARGVAGRLFPWGNNWDENCVWSVHFRRDVKKGTGPVGAYGVTPDGITDMAGNVWQWCRDYYREAPLRANASASKDPFVAAGSNEIGRVQRGGSWDFEDSRSFRSANRAAEQPHRAKNDQGFRCVALP